MVEVHMMILSIPPMVAVPLRRDEAGAIRVGETRVLLEIVIRAFNRGQTPEDIVQSFSSLKLDDVYAVITYYLQNQSEVDSYIEQIEAEGQLIREKIEANQPDMRQIRDRLLKRQSEKK
jgi:uncharacterized protein (DUF433 family)